ncbi:MAG TPA: hypothetical protein VHF22_13355, partial [Planctomycetota bacterium]|nr:hypothetical protein [Planctomycetota bacterium]
MRRALAIVLLAATAALAGTETAREIYVPRSDWDQVIAREGKGVVLRYRDLVELARRGERATSPPVPAVIESATYAGVYADDAARFEAKVRIRVLASDRTAAVGAPPPPGVPVPADVAPGAIVLPLGLGGAGVTEALLDGQPAPVAVNAAGEATIVLPGVPGERTLALRFSVRAERRGAGREVAFGLPRAPIARLDLDVPEALDAAPEPALFVRKPLADGRSRLPVTLGGAGR